MSRNSSGTYTPTAGQPVVTGTVIDPTVFNNLVADVGTEITDSLSRSGKGGMSAPVRGTDGTNAAPAHSFTNEPGSGLYRVGAAELGVSVTATKVLDLTPTLVTDTVDLTVQGATGLTLTQGNAILSKAADQQVTKSGGKLIVGTSDANDVQVIRSGAVVLAATSTSLDNQSRPIINVTNPTNNQDAATKLYVDTNYGLKANVASPTFTGTVTLPPTGSGPLEAATRNYVDLSYQRQMYALYAQTNGAGVAAQPNSVNICVSGTASPSYLSADGGFVFATTNANPYGAQVVWWPDQSEYVTPFYYIKSTTLFGGMAGSGAMTSLAYGPTPGVCLAVRGTASTTNINWTSGPSTWTAVNVTAGGGNATAGWYRHCMWSTAAAAFIMVGDSTDGLGTLRCATSADGHTGWTDMTVANSGNGTATGGAVIGEVTRVGSTNNKRLIIRSRYFAWTSDNGGTTWTQNSPGTLAAAPAYGANTGILLAASLGTSNAFLLTADGVTWNVGYCPNSGTISSIAAHSLASGVTRFLICGSTGVSASPIMYE